MSLRVKRGFKSWAERQAEHWRREVNLQAWQAMPSETLAERLKVKFICPRTIDGFSSELQELLLGPRSTEWSAAAFAVNAHYVVVENTTHSIERREATRMHEMAHIICGHKPIGFSDAGELGVMLRGHDPDQEDEADCLGRCLHLPKPLLGWCLNRKYTHEQISSHCKASLELVRLRLNTSGVLHVRRHMG